MSTDPRRRRPLYGPPPRSSRSTLSTYAPLVLTLTLASAGLAAWIWSERRTTPSYPPTDDEELYRYTSDDETAPPPYPPRSSASGERAQSQGVRDEGLLGRVSEAARSASPGLYDSAGRVVGAGVAAVSAGAAALGLVRSEERREGSAAKEGKVERRREGREEGFSDHERWSEEAAKRSEKGKGKERDGARKRTVAVVVSAQGMGGFEGEELGLEHTSILSHLPQAMDPATTTLFVLIYAPGVTDFNPAERGMSASYSTIELPGRSGANVRMLEALTMQARALVESPTQILPFSTPTGYVHMLRHVAPQLVYIADTPALSGTRGENLAQLKGWVGQTIVVVGDDGLGGLVDTETETEDEGARNRKRKGWWESSDMVGLGKGLEVVDVRRVGEDWRRRING
ncbi:hypothetical protein B9Z65_3412 [Elsinoe australis]|uniref:Uncharacterized protein n=1 Tax=Elsinoe australis TaxID=40998 RepID=A0A2P7ZYD1_9PEZI|nr:hypothetical protein B9Z65_3412 [Elsinoe australis]